MDKVKLSSETSATNRDEQVVAGFGEEWSRFSQEQLADSERQAIFDDYFSNFPWGELSADANGADIGCGSGRWALVAAPLVGRLICVDASDEALDVAKRNLANHTNVSFCHADVGELPFEDGELDFAYSLGVLHHVPDTEGAIASVSRTLKPGAPFLIYLYYAFDNRPLWFRGLWRLTDFLRRLICKLPSCLRFKICDLIAAAIYWPLAKVAAIMRLLNLPLGNFPLKYYRDKSFYVMRTDALDRFGTRLEKRFSKEQVVGMLQAAGFEDIQFSTKEPFWCALARKR
jgi:ubiquinone/menaquinone biosynthesis C-methylase UbiE